jgi:hypothetical protein
MKTKSFETTKNQLNADYKLESSIFFNNFNLKKNLQNDLVNSLNKDTFIVFIKIQTPFAVSPILTRCD